MSDTLFTFFMHKVSDADDTTPPQSVAYHLPPFESVMNVSEKTPETLFLDNGDTRTVTLPGYASSDWVMIVARVVGYAKLITIGVDWDGSTPITGETHGYGAGRHAGYITLTTKNVTSFQFEGLADGTLVQYLALRVIPDSQL